MATSSIKDKFVIKSKKSLDRLDEAFASQSKYSNTKPLSDEELKKGSEIVLKCISRRSDQS